MEDRNPKSKAIEGESTRFVWSLLIVTTVVGAFLILLLASGSEVAAPRAAGKLDRLLDEALVAQRDDSLRVIVRTRPGTLIRTTDAVEQSGFVVHEEFPFIDAFTTTVPLTMLARLGDYPDVLSVSADAVVEKDWAKKAQGNGKAKRAKATSSTSTSSTDPAPTDATAEPKEGSHLHNTLGIDDEPWDGRDIHVAVLDSGIHESVDGTGRRGQYDFTGGQSRYRSQPEDPYGHGTHVAGLVAAPSQETGGLFRGLAPNAKLYSFQVLDAAGVGYTSDVIRAIQHILTNRKHLWTDIINLSLGHPILETAATDPLVQAVEAAVREGIVVVVSAGNYGTNRDTGEVGYAGITSPGNAPSAITVGALDTRQTDRRDDDTVATFSSRGPTWYDALAKPDIVAPATSLVSNTTWMSSLLLDNPQLQVETTSVGDTAYISLSGTSMGAAVTTGVVALMLEANDSFDMKTRRRRLTPNAVKAILRYTALPLPGYDTLTQGAGAINADGAVALAAAIDPTAGSGEWWAGPVSETSTIAGSVLTWGQRFIWGDRFIWGSSIYYADSTVWGPDTVWGDRFIWGAGTEVLIGVQ